MTTKYRCWQNIGEEKILTMPKCRFWQNIAANKISATICHVVKPEPREFLAVFTRQINWPKEGERAGWIAVWSSSLMGWQKPAQFRTRIVSDVLLLSYLDKFGLRVTVEAGQALAVLYSKARLYKGPRLAGLSQWATTRSTGNISMWIQKVGHSNTRGTVSFLFFPAQNNCCT